MGGKSDERLALEARAAELGLDVPHNIGDAKLASRVEEAEEAAAQAAAPNPAAPEGGEAAQATPAAVVAPDPDPAEAEGIIAAETLEVVRWNGARQKVGAVIYLDADEFARLEKRGAVRLAELAGD